MQCKSNYCSGPISSFVVNFSHENNGCVQIFNFFCPFTSIVSSDVLCPSTHVVFYVFDSHFFPSFDVMPFASQIGEGTNFNFNHMALAFEICEGIDLKFLIRELVLKCHFFEINNKEMQNVNKGSRRVSKHDEQWEKNAFVNGESSMVLM